MPRKWTLKDIPSLTGKVAVVTGSSSGIGYEIANALSQAGAHVVIAVRNETKASDAMARIQEENPDAVLTYLPLDLTSLDSVTEFARGTA